MDPKPPLSASAKDAGDGDMLRRFVELLAELWLDLIGPSGEEGPLQNALRQIVDFLGVDRMSILELSADGDELRVARSYAKPGAFPPPAVMPAARFPWLTRHIRDGRIVQLDSPDDLPEEAAEEKAFALADGLVANVTIPLIADGVALGAVAVGWHRRPRHWSADMMGRFHMIGRAFANFMLRSRLEASLRSAYEEIRKLQQQLEMDCSFLQEEIKAEHNFDAIIGNSDAISDALRKVRQVGPFDTTVLIMGETGTGKELFARAVHDISPRRDRPLLKINCAALPPTLIESELFGHEKGAFTGAIAARVGRFEAADGGTVFLDEIGELPVEIQAKLLRVLQYGELEKLGTSETARVDVRIIAATNRDLENEIQQGRFRKDLYYRLRVFPITIPALRARAGDIPLMVEAFLERICRKLGKPVLQVQPTTMAALRTYTWPGNVRELESILEHGVIISDGPSLTIELPAGTTPTPASDQTLAQMESAYIRQKLEETHWKISGPGGAAERLGLHPNTLRSRLKKYNIRR